MFFVQHLYISGSSMQIIRAFLFSDYLVTSTDITAIVVDTVC